MPTSAPISEDDPRRAEVLDLLSEHLADMYATSPAESVHALDADALAGPGMAFWTWRAEDGSVLGCVALKELDPQHGELKSMRTTAASRGRGVGTALLGHVLEVGRARGYRRISLETGSQDFFAPARSLYLRHGFVPTTPFADYTEDPASVFLTLDLAGAPDGGAVTAPTTSGSAPSH
ncbi:GNAT family N-acetyltransferase [Nocardioides sambongensis]|uniref:GNAT family N-acetyltransferase n=1 Tax=Nocardioides sambongensis TaxID=2589074 RepID=UPI00112832A7|nr:GNAT family N-acetyltransferase [Nocardioides sambongensis]